MIRFRQRVLQVGFIFSLLGVVGRIAYVQSAESGRLQRLAQSEWRGYNTVQPVRGRIYDALGGLLAYSEPAYTVDVNAQAIRQAGLLNEVSSGLSRILGANRNAVAAQIARRGVAWLQMYPYLIRIPYAKEQEVLSLFQRLHLQSDVNAYKTYRRVYPNGTLASQVVGFTNEHGQGVSGIEYQYNQYLEGRAGLRSFVQDVSGNPIPFYPEKNQPAQNGDNVYLTVNPVIQNYAEQALATVQKRFHPKHAAIIVANPNTGAILAMATLPTFNPNQYWKYPASTLFNNWAVSDPFEPGSTFKPEVLTGALATHSIRLNQTYMSGVVYVNGVPIRDWNLYGWGRLTYEQAIIYSSNVGLVHIGQAEGVKNFYHYMDLFGINQKTGIDLPGEASPILFPEKGLNPVDFATMTFGQGLAITPIQQVAAIGAIANGGHLLRPYLVQKIVTPAGRTVFQHKVQVVRTVASKQIMNTVTDVMVKTVNQDPQGNVGMIPGYSVAGKTGTAEIPKPGGGYYANRYNLSFIGFAPAHHPRLEIYVTVNQPVNTAQWGDWVATPAARYVLKRGLAYLQIPPHLAPGVSHGLTGPAASAKKPRGPERYVRVPDLVGKTMASARASLRAAGFGEESVGGSAGRVLDQWPRAGAEVPFGRAVVLELPGKAPGPAVRVPDFSGMSMKEAMHVSAAAGLRLVPSGAGFAVSQRAAPGTRLPLGTGIAVQFSPAP